MLVHQFASSSARSKSWRTAQSESECRNSATENIGTRLVTTYLSYLHDSQMEDGWFHNFMGYDRTWQDRRGSPDSFGRALWGLGYCMRFAPRESWRGIARRLVLKALPHVGEIDHLRSNAYVVLGLVHAAEAAPDDRAELRAALVCAVKPIADGFEQQSRPDWLWCEPTMTYDNARLPEALLRAGRALGDTRLCDAGIRMLDFYTGVVIEDGIFIPIGNNGWYARAGPRARHGQQPIEAAALIDACLAARAATGDVRFLRTAEIAFDWFFGSNTAEASLIFNGGCCDGIDASGPNPNMGAESTLAYLHSAMAVARPVAARLQIVR